jgi:hypothetical protein
MDMHAALATSQPHHTPPPDIDYGTAPPPQPHSLDRYAQPPADHSMYRPGTPPAQAAGAHDDRSAAPAPADPGTAPADNAMAPVDHGMYDTRPRQVPTDHSMYARPRESEETRG